MSLKHRRKRERSIHSNLTQAESALQGKNMKQKQQGYKPSLGILDWKGVIGKSKIKTDTSEF